jgi:prepilin-type N-terminal cleavage/methylation domain-containing protein
MTGRTNHHRRGYTVVEVMMALTLFAIGAAGVISMQRVTIQGGDDARHFDMASNIAREWQHRLQRDSLNWTEPNSVVLTSNLDTATLWLKSTNIDDPPATWKVPATGPQLHGYSAAFDLLGKDIAPTSPDRVFCVQYRLGWIARQTAPTGLAPTALIRAEIRVFWSRLEFGPPDCSDVSIFETPASRNRHHFIFVTTAIRGNPTQ